MNWLIISSEFYNREKNQLENFFKSKKNHIDSLEINNENMYNFDFSSDSKLCIDSITKKLEKADFLLYIIDEDKLFSPLSMFVFGFVQALHIPLYLICKNEKTLLFSKAKQVYFYKTIEELLLNFKTNFPSISKEKLHKNSQKKICELGLSFSLDGFAQAISQDNLFLSELYISSGIDLNGRDSCGTPLLNIATRANNIEIVKKLLKHSVLINEKSMDRGYTALMDAVWKSNLPLVKLLIEAGSDVNHIADDGQSVLVLATGTNNFEICEALVKAGASSHLKDNMGMSALDYARLFKKEYLVSLYENGGL